MKLPRMTKPVAALAPGAVLAEPVCDDAGNVLLPAGARLTAAALASLQRRGIATVSVVEDDPAAIEAVRAAQRARLEFLFRDAGSSLSARMLFDAVLAYRQRRLP